MASCDVIVVGMRCAGAALALLLVRAGHSVLALGRASFPSDTVSTHFLRPRTTAFLAKWGLYFFSINKSNLSNINFL